MEKLYLHRDQLQFLAQRSFAQSIRSSFATVTKLKKCSRLKDIIHLFLKCLGTVVNLNTVWSRPGKPVPLKQSRSCYLGKKRKTLQKEHGLVNAELGQCDFEPRRQNHVGHCIISGNSQRASVV